MKIAIIDDSEIDRTLILKMITAYCEKHQTLFEAETYPSGESFLNSFKENKFNLVLLDVYMQQIDGMEVASQVRNLDKDCLLVFITSSPDHAVESYKVRAFDYLLKPLNQESLYKTMDLCCEALNNKGKYIEVKQGRAMVKIRINDILYTDYSNHYIYIHTNKDIVKTYYSFEAFSPMLLPYPQFLCCYRNCLINMDAVSEMEEKNFVMSNRVRVPISKVNRAEIKSQYADYIFNKLG